MESEGLLFNSNFCQSKLNTFYSLFIHQGDKSLLRPDTLVFLARLSVNLSNRVRRFEINELTLADSCKIL
jgi:hypothetical protein